jgi:hypothetical protein
MANPPRSNTLHGRQRFALQRISRIAFRSMSPPEAVGVIRGRFRDETVTTNAALDVPPRVSSTLIATVAVRTVREQTHRIESR